MLNKITLCYNVKRIFHYLCTIRTFSWKLLKIISFEFYIINIFEHERRMTNAASVRKLFMEI